MSLYDVPFRIGGQINNEPQAIADLKTLEKSFRESTWLRGNHHEPLVGDPDCPYLAQAYGLSRRSCLSVFVDTHTAGYKCRFERCFAFTFKNLDEALKHLRQHHFGNRPFVCLPENGTTWYVTFSVTEKSRTKPFSPIFNSLLMWRFSAGRISSQKRSYESTRSSAHRRITCRHQLPLFVASFLPLLRSL